MFDFSLLSKSDTKAVLAALSQSLGIIEFDPTGTILCERKFLQGSRL